ncbi:olfactory receptor 151-like [Rhinatrema bivittatum]|uniref:olfactory receptor 151-like n=1 Tax=Rhinatrema bivittatum TaxID=194408 RepID=UPI00112714D8|nr:olfactory receptor 151-like [Rhinatrema bivittatum]
MEEENVTAVKEFIILGFPEYPELQIPLFLLFLLIYLIILMGNLTIIALTCLDPRLHTPMYFFLCSLSFLDISSTSVTLPKLLDILLRKRQRISANGCFAQVYFFIVSAFVEFLLLTVMAYDRYVAVCHPLRYAVIMTQRLCINHFFCDLSALLKLSCTSTSDIEFVTYIFGGLIELPSITSTLVSYVYIISTILRIRSTEGRRKAFSTCSSHLTVVILFYGTLISAEQIAEIKSDVCQRDLEQEVEGVDELNPMEEENLTTVTEFIILGFPEFPDLQIPLFLLFLLIYLIILTGNLTIIALTCLDPRLHTPMYFFLCNLSFLDISSTSVTLPKLLDIFLRKRQHISLIGCFTQLYFFIFSEFVEFILLTVMAYDRYVAVCHPLRYAVIMTQRLCVLTVAALWLFGILYSVTYIALLLCFSYCGSNEINHFFCDLSALLKLSCTSTSTVECMVYIIGASLGLPCIISTFVSYFYIISSILRIRSTEGRHKAFSTCSSHLTVVILFYGTTLCSYMRPTSTQSLNQNKLFAVLYNALIPMFNPMIYSLRNQEVKKALRKTISRKDIFRGW